MGSTAIQLAQAAAAEMGLPIVSYLYSANADNTGRQLGALLNRLGQMVQRANDWTFLTAECHFTLPPTLAITGTLTKGSAIITGITSGNVTSLTPLIGKAVVQGQGLVQSTRLVGASITPSPRATMDQVATASVTGTAISVMQDSFPLPADYSRPINRTAWDRSMRWELRGPQSAQWDQWVRSGIVATGPRRQYRELNNMWRFWPPPGSSSQDTNATMITEYITKFWALSTGGTPKPAFTVDSDTALFEDDIMISGLKYLFFQMKGFAFDELKMQFQRILQAEMATDGPSPTLDMTRTTWPVFISPANVQDTGFGNP